MGKNATIPKKFPGLSLAVRMDKHDAELLAVAAKDHFVSPHQLARMVIQNYLAGYTGPYVLRKPIDEAG